MVTDRQGAGFQRADVTGRAGLERARIVHGEAQTRCGDGAGVAHLTTGFGVERRLVEKHHGAFAGLQLFDGRAVTQDRQHLRAAHGLRIAGEFGFHVDRRDFDIAGAEAAGGARLLALALHLALEAVEVDFDVAFAGDVRGQVHRKAVGVVKLEYGVAGNALRAGLDRVLEQAHALFQGLREAVLLLPDHTLQIIALLLEFRIRVAHDGGQRCHQLVEEGVFEAQLVTMADRATHDATQDIAPALVGRHHTVGDQETGRTDVVGHDFQRRVTEIKGSGQARHGPDQSLEDVDIVVVVHALHQRADTLQAHAGVHRGLGQRRQRAVGGALELHEHQIPDLDPAVAVFFRGAGRTAPDAERPVRVMVVEDFGAGSARAGIAHLPEVVRTAARLVTDAHDAIHGHADLILPDVVGLIVGGIDGDQQAIR